MGKDSCCGGGCGCSDSKEEAHDHGHDHDHHHHNPLENLDEETQIQIQELQMMEQNFQQLLMQKNAFSVELNETKEIEKEVEKTSGEVSRIIGGQVLIKTTKKDLLNEMKEKKNLLESRMKSIDDKEKDFAKKITKLREEILKKIQK